jgi:uncharacterized protein
MIKNFPDWGELKLEDQALFAEYTEREQPEVSELSFENLFVWRYSYNLQVSILDGALCILARPDPNPPFVFPPLGASDAPATVRRLFEDMRQRDMAPQMQRCSERFVKRLSEGSDDYNVEVDRNHSDYVYLASDLADLSGRKYHKKRNQIARFQKKYEFEYRRITPDIMSLCTELQGAWCDIHDCLNPENVSLGLENQAAFEALNSFDSLNMIGGAILVEGKVEAFALGGPLNKDTFVIHFEKGNTELPGIYQVVNQALCGDIEGYTFINREQDLGDPGLRQAKESYYPHHMVDKYIVKPRG